MRLVPVLLVACAAPTADPGSPTPTDTGAPPVDTATPTAPTAQTDPTTQEWSGLLARDNVWYTDVSAVEPDPSSGAIRAFLSEHGFGFGRAQIDFSFEVLAADASTPRRSFVPTDDFYTPDCDEVPVPLPDWGRIEGESGYACTSDGDCHLIVVEAEERRIYEMWRADVTDTFRGGCLAVWDMDAVYGPTGRGDQCTSADAAGFPIAPLLVTADEVAAGEIGHALRFVLPNSAIRAGEFVRPATHGTGVTEGPPAAPPYGARLRLRADFPLERLPNDAARTVARALQRYGMFLSDGGRVLFTFQSDTTSTAKWANLLGSHDLEAIEPADFDVMPLGTPVPLTLDCDR